MKNTDNLRRQHQELAGLAAELERTSDPHGSRQLLSRFRGKLQMHAAMEEEALYPRLLADPRPEVHGTAKRLRDEFGGVYSAVDAFLNRWLASGAIEGDTRMFVDERTALVAALRKRIQTEETQLYPLAD
jgi:hypothetical protein